MSKPSKKQKVQLGPVERTERGFQIINFKDAYDEPCSLQMSSAAIYEKPGTSFVWLGCDSETVHEKTGQKCGARMHLDRKQVEALIVHLSAWLTRDTFKP